MRSGTEGVSAALERTRRKGKRGGNRSDSRGSTTKARGVARWRNKEEEKGLRDDTRSETSGATELRDTIRHDTARYETAQNSATREQGEGGTRRRVENSDEAEAKSQARGRLRAERERGKWGSYPILQALATTGRGI